MSRTAAPPTRPPEPDGPRQVSKFEFNLLRILRFAVGQFPADSGMQLLRSGIARPECLSASAVELVKDTLSKACVLALVRLGGWRKDRYLRAGEPVRGRVWERIPLDERVLEFSPHVMEFLIWATAEKVNETRVDWDAAPETLTAADEFLFWMTLDHVRPDPELLAVLRSKRAFRSNPLCWISFPGDMAESEESQPPAFAPMFEGLRAVILECLQPHLTQRWIRSERMKCQIGDWKRMRHQGHAEYAALQGFLAAAHTARRTDLTRFALRANAELFTGELTPVFWTGGLQGGGPLRLADRLETQRAALALARQMDTLEQWQRQALGVGYFDDGYQASQMWKTEWEALQGDRVSARARAAIEMLEPLRGPQNRPPNTPGSRVAGDNPEVTTE